MRVYVSLVLMVGLLVTTLGIDPSVLPSPLARLASAWHVSHPHFLFMVELVLVLVATGIEARLGSPVLLAAWGVPCLLHTLIYGRAWPELAALSVLTTILTVTVERKESRPWKIWAPLWFGTICMLLMLSPGVGPVATALLIGWGVGRLPKSEPVSVLGLASGAALVFAWLA